MPIGLGTPLMHKSQSLPVVVGKVYEHHIGKALATLNKVATHSFSKL